MASIAPLSDVLGARIDGLDVSERLVAHQSQWLADALHRHGFIVLKNQSLTPAQMVTFAKQWGRPSPHVIDTFHHPDDANILILSNVFKDGKPTGLVDAGTYFHTDYSYLDDVARCTILHAQDVPPAPNGTTFANQAKAYADLPSGMKEKIKNLVVKHHYGNRDDLDKQSRSVASVLNAEQAQRVNWVRHPLVKPHPFSGQLALYAVSGSSFGIEGMPDDEALDLLRELAVHATQDKYCYTNNYENGDVIVWDNTLLLHSAPLIDLTRPRTLWRVTVLNPQGH
jgi:taurine dioxygenase